MAETMRSDLGALQHERLLLALVLQRGFVTKVFEAVEGQGRVFLEELRQVIVFSAVVGLLVKVHRADADLRVFKVRHDDDDEVVGAHVAEQADEATLVELHELLGDPDGFQVTVIQPAFDEDIAGNAGNVLLDQHAAAGEKTEPVRGKQVLEFKAVDARGIGLLDIEMVGIVVVGVDDPDAERLRVAEGAEVDAVDVKVRHDREIAVDLEQGVDALQILVECAHVLGAVGHGLPERRPAVGVNKRRGLLEITEPFIRDGQLAVAPVAVQVGAEFADDGIARLLLRLVDVHRVSRHEGRVTNCVAQANPLCALAAAGSSRNGLFHLQQQPAHTLDGRIGDGLQLHRPGLRGREGAQGGQAGRTIKQGPGYPAGN